MTNETTPDAVEAALCKMYRIIVCDYGALSDMTVTATLALEGFLAERARHAEEVARLRDVNLDETRALDDLRLKEIASLRDQLRGSCEAEELRSGLEKLMADGDPRGADIVSRDSLQALLDKVDARDSLLTLETIDSLRDQLRRVEGEREEALRMVDGIRKSEKTARESMVINMRLRDEAQAENVQLKAELTTLRSLLPDVRALARWAIETEHMSDHVNTDQIGDVGRRILAALDSQGGEGE